MSSSRINFSQPFWEYLIPLFSFIGLLPFLFLNFSDQVALDGSWPFADELELSLTGNYVFVSVCLALFSWKMNSLVNKHILSNKDNFFFSLLLVLYGSAIILNFGASSFLAPLLLFSFALDHLFHASRDSLSQQYIYNSGFFLGCILLLNSGLWYFSVALLVVLFVLRGFLLKDLTVFLVGVFTTWLLKVSVDFILNDCWNVGLSFHYLDRVILELPELDMAFLTCLALVTASGLFLSRTYLKSSSNKSKVKFQLVLISYITLFLFGFFFFDKSVLAYHLLLLLPLTTLLGVIGIELLKNRILTILLVCIHLVIFGSWIVKFIM